MRNGTLQKTGGTLTRGLTDNMDSTDMEKRLVAVKRLGALILSAFRKDEIFDVRKFSF
jgi:hypothetical protein